MTKKILILLLFLPMVLAFEEGDIYTQEQIDNADFSDFDYSTIGCRSENRVFFAGNSINHIYSCLNLKRSQNLTQYEVYRRYYFLTIPLWFLDWCQSEYGWEFCAQHYNGFIQNPDNGVFSAMATAEGIIQNLKGYQQDYLPENYRTWLENRELFPP